MVRNPKTRETKIDVLDLHIRSPILCLGPWFHGQQDTNGLQTPLSPHGMDFCTPMIILDKVFQQHS